MTDVKTDSLVPAPQERSLAKRALTVVKGKLSGPSESRMTSEQLAARQQQKENEERAKMASFRRELGEVGSVRVLEQDGKILDEVYHKVLGTSQDLLGILNTYRQGYAGYFRRDRLGEYKHDDEEWVHLPRSLPDGSHVVLQYESLHKRSLVPSFLRKTKDVSKDAFYQIRAFVVPAEEVDVALAHNDMNTWLEKFSRQESYYEYCGAHRGRAWRISLDPQTKPVVNPYSISYFHSTLAGEENLALPKDNLPEDTYLFRNSLWISLSGNVEVEAREKGKEPHPRDRVMYSFDGGKLVLPGQKREEGVEYSKFAGEMISQLEEVVQLATT